MKANDLYKNEFISNGAEWNDFIAQEAKYQSFIQASNHVN
ncbi:BH1292 [Halalkalibacterium halodurans C-125]|uniref:BH1292 protein n=1 Tax=Halalkalibacterium halodurans (strain ATCC BAA-125 / DSM 18197 / FERM 7344 / JCM 9153 / C-125) TaxID=272558 RepID=Q9KDC1_HALH5|nr:BH1292 [Halalkalibacterium halodurans C-125]